MLSPSQPGAGGEFSRLHTEKMTRLSQTEWLVRTKEGAPGARVPDRDRREGGQERARVGAWGDAWIRATVAGETQRERCQ